MSGESAPAVHGWGCTPTTDPTEIIARPRILQTIFVKRWQRTALFVILGILMLLIFLNIALTLWIITALKLSMNSIGSLKILKGGIQLEGETHVTDRLIASSIRSRPAQPITVHSYRNFSVLVSDSDQREYSKLIIKRDKLQCGRTFEVTDSRGSIVFKASREEVRVSAETLAVDGSGGVSVRSALQAPIIRAPPGSDLQLESQTRRLDLRAPQLINLESRAGSIDVSSHGQIQLNSVVGAIRIDAQNIYFNKLRQATPISSLPARNKSEKPVKVFQLCACASGKLFLAAPEAQCVQHSDDVEMCR